MEKQTISLDDLPVEEIELNQQQSDLYEADTDVCKILLGTAGEQAGKTTVGILWLRKEVAKYWDEYPYNYLVGANTYKTLKQSTKEKFNEIFTNYLGYYNQKEEYFQLIREGHPHGKIFFRSQGTDGSGDSLIGIPNCKAALGDEVAKWRRAFYIKFLGRLSRLNGPFFGCGTAYAANFIKKEIVDNADKGDPRYIYRRWTCFDNPSYDKSRIELLRSQLTPREYNKLVLGLIEKAEGLVHEYWGDDNYTDIVSRETSRIGSIDWGFDHPMASLVFACDGQHATIESISKMRHLTPTQQIDLVKSKQELFKCKMWFAGHDRPDMIAELQQAGIPVVKYFEMRPDLREIIGGDQKASELIRNRKLKIKRGIAQLEDFEDEIETYVWDKDDEDEGKEKPVDKNNDLMACLRYGVVGLISLKMLSTKVEVPKEHISTVIHRDYGLTKKKKSWGNY